MTGTDNCLQSLMATNPLQEPIFRRAGLEEVTARTFVGDVCAPLSGEIRSALTALIEMRWVDVGAEL